MVRRGAKLLHAFGEASVPRVTLVTRKIYGGAYIAMNFAVAGATKVFAWPDAEVAVMGAKAAVGILHKKKLAAAADHERDALHEELAAEHERIAGGVDSAIEIGVVDEKIDPAHARSKLTQALAEAPTRRGRHKNIPCRDRTPVAIPTPTRNPRRSQARRSRSPATRPMRVRRSRMSSTVRAPSWVTANSNSARVTSMPSATGSVGRAQRAEAITLATSAPYRAISEPGSSPVVRSVATGFAGAPTSGRLRVRQPPAIMPRSARRCRARPRPCAGIPVSFAAHHAEHPGVGFDDGVVTGDVGGSARPGVQQWAQAGVGPDHVGGAERGGQRRVDGVEQESHLIRGRLRHVGNRARRLLVGQPQVDAPQLLGHREHEPVGLPGIGTVSAAVGLPNEAASNTKGGCRGSAAAIDGSTSAAHTPVALMTTRAETSNRPR